MFTNFRNFVDKDGKSYRQIKMSILPGGISLSG